MSIIEKKTAHLLQDAMRALAAKDTDALKTIYRSAGTLMATEGFQRMLKGNAKTVQAENPRSFKRGDGSPGFSFRVKRGPDDKHGIEHIAHGALALELQGIANVANGHPFRVTVDGREGSRTINGANGPFRVPVFLVEEAEAPAPAPSRAPAAPNTAPSAGEGGAPARAGRGFSRFAASAEVAPEPSDEPVYDDLAPV